MCLGGVLLSNANFLPYLEKEAKKRQKQAGKNHGKGQSKVVATLPQPNGEKSRDEAARKTGASPRNVSKAKNVKGANQGCEQ